MSDPFTSHRAASLALLNAGVDLRQKEGQFLGGMAFMAEEPTEKQAHWLDVLLRRHDLPPMVWG